MRRSRSFKVTDFGTNRKPIKYITYILSRTVSKLLRGGRGFTWRLPSELRKTSENNIFKPNKPENPRTSGAMSFGLRDAMLSQLHVSSLYLYLTPTVCEKSTRYAAITVKVIPYLSDGGCRETILYARSKRVGHKFIQLHWKFILQVRSGKWRGRCVGQRSSGMKKMSFRESRPNTARTASNSKCQLHAWSHAEYPTCHLT